MLNNSPRRVITGDFVLLREIKCGVMKYWEQISIIC